LRTPANKQTKQDHQKMFITPFILFIVCSYIFFEFISTDVAERTSIYYSAPVFQMKNTNITLGSSMRAGRQRQEKILNIGEILAVMCQAELINRKNASVSIDGIINIAIQEYDVDSSSQGPFVSLLANNLYYADNGTKVNQAVNADLAGIFGISDFGTAKINSFASNFFDIPFVTAGSLSRNSPNNVFIGDFPAENRTFFQIQPTKLYNIFNAVLDILIHFNWTIVGNVYQSNAYGYRRQSNVMDYSGNNSSPIFTCNVVFEITEERTSNFEILISEFCACVDEISSVNVIVLWMETSTAQVIISEIRSYCPWTINKWTYIIADDNLSPLSAVRNSDAFNYALLVRDNGPWPYQSFLQDCQENARPRVANVFKDLYEELNLLSKDCEIYSDPDVFQACTTISSDFDPYAVCVDV